MHTSKEATPLAANQWTTGLCGCCDDAGVCCLTMFCPCITFGRIAEIVDRGSSSCGMSGAMYALLSVLVGFQCVYSCAYRSKMRNQYGLPTEPCADCLVHCCCEHLSLCQEYRELQNRGFDMKIGWYANMEKHQGRGANVAPAVPAGMTR